MANFGAYFGPIPGIPVGTTWQNRKQVSQSGVHRPLIAGIHGREELGAFSIVASGAYASDADNGTSFGYTGSGGILHVDKGPRVGVQVLHQKLRRGNRALALNCAAPVNDIYGADAGRNWRAGLPLRVVRKHTTLYGPEQGYRYDGIYKVVRYYPSLNANQLRIWHFEMRRDDPEPAPWSQEYLSGCQQPSLQLTSTVAGSSSEPVPSTSSGRVISEWHSMSTDILFVDANHSPAEDELAENLAMDPLASPEHPEPSGEVKIEVKEEDV